MKTMHSLDHIEKVKSKEMAFPTNNNNNDDDDSSVKKHKRQERKKNTQKLN